MSVTNGLKPVVPHLRQIIATADGYVNKDKENFTYLAALNPSVGLRLISLSRWALEARDALQCIKSLGFKEGIDLKNLDPKTSKERGLDIQYAEECLSKFPKEEE